ncbi:MAG: RlmE family RNA methyltransferase [Candidatus Omnitrophota bacterium]|nr:RlmE family RNA methyltransferase [Candidatus Omnitrophota bacterium]
MKYQFSKTDTYTRRAKKENYPARSIYKLQEIDQKYKIVKVMDRVLDLGCAPGSWLLYLSKEIGYNGKIVGVDINDLKIEIPQNAILIKEDVMKFETTEKFNAVVSDLSAHTTGIDFSDAEETLELCWRALEIAKKVLIKGGNFVCKIFEGEGTDEFFKEIEKSFEFSKRFKPKASRKQSREMYVVAMGFGC